MEQRRTTSYNNCGTFSGFVSVSKEILRMSLGRQEYVLQISIIFLHPSVYPLNHTFMQTLISWSLTTNSLLLWLNHALNCKVWCHGWLISLEMRFWRKEAYEAQQESLREKSLSVSISGQLIWSVTAYAPHFSISSQIVHAPKTCFLSYLLDYFKVRIGVLHARLSILTLQISMILSVSLTIMLLKLFSLQAIAISHLLCHISRKCLGPQCLTSCQLSKTTWALDLTCVDYQCW